MEDSEDGSNPGRHSVLDRSGSTIHYWIAGPEDGPLVAFTHGATMDHRMFDLQVGPVVDAGYRVLTWDVRGHGRSKPIGMEFTLPAVVEDFLAIVDALGADEVTPVGQSFGGYVSQELAFRYPGRVPALVVVGSTNVTALPSTLEYAALRLSPYVFRVWPYRHLRRTIAKSTAETEPVRRYAHDAASRLSKREFLAVWEAVATCLHAEPGYRFGKPLLLTHGEHDGTGTVARDAPTWAATEPECRYEVVPDAGHNANQDNSEFFNSLLLEFLREHVPV
ncbi:alpha/beta hydrolase [Halorarum halophilum]|uniref:Alpha/beta hydrolase n=1 Tax=Halorarum halophilum TaxID=2743090 RepID=A0A7D5KNT5_9EURY|nr:alpha/beta hydrolase [Halobaculum halophilum]QLG28782.1 alpha/beta hydrolase [Halobaculum halophilum]